MGGEGKGREGTRGFIFEIHPPLVMVTVLCYGVHSLQAPSEVTCVISSGE